jgi:hypothetical protein
MPTTTTLLPFLLENTSSIFIENDVLPAGFSFRNETRPTTTTVTIKNGSTMTIMNVIARTQGWHVLTAV